MERTGLWIFSMSLVRYWGDKQKQRLLLVDKVCTVAFWEQTLFGCMMSQRIVCVQDNYLLDGHLWDQ